MRRQGALGASQLVERSAGVFALVFLLSAFLLSAAGLSACGSSERAMHLHAASSLALVVPRLVQAFERTDSVRVNVEYGASSAIARQIERGAPADVFLSADRRWTDHLEERELVVGGGVPFARDRLVALVHEGVDPPADLRALAGLRLAMPSEDVPLGELSREAFRGAGVTPSRVVESTDARSALAWVARGEVDGMLGFAAAVGTDGTREAFRLDQPSARYVAIATSESPHAEHFLRFLETDEAKQILDDAGYAMP